MKSGDNLSHTSFSGPARGARLEVLDGQTRPTSGAAKQEGEEQQWVKDFPIVVGQDNYVARRDFTKFMVLTSFAFVVGQLWIGFENIRRKARALPPMRAIANLAQIPVGTAIQFAYPTDNDPCLLIRISENELAAFSQKCTHLSCAVVPRVSEHELFCPCHEGRFDLETGKPISGPPRRPLPRIKLEVRGGTIYATGVELRTT